MKVFTAAVVVILLVSGLFAQPTVASITYDLISYPAHQDGFAQVGWSLTGHIVTDGTLGPYLSASSIIAWDWQSSKVLDGVTWTFGGSSDTPGSGISTFGLDATSTTLSVDLAHGFNERVEGAGYEYEGFLVLTAGNSKIAWGWFDSVEDAGSWYYAYGDATPSEPVFPPTMPASWPAGLGLGNCPMPIPIVHGAPADKPPSYGSWPIGESESIESAGPTVPEPSTLIIWSLLGAIAITVAWRRRQSAGTQPAQWKNKGDRRIY
jgi:hypothetical protein